MKATRTPRAGRGALLLAGAFGALLASAVGVALIAVLIVVSGAGQPCGSSSLGGSGQITLGPAGTGRRVGATEYGGPGDPSSGTVGASGQSLLAHPDSFAELGGTSFQTATAMGGLAYMTPLRVTWGRRSAIAYKRDFGLGGGPVGGLPRVIDLWWQFAGALGVPYERGMWSGPVRVARPPAAGAGNLLGQSAAQATSLIAPAPVSGDAAGCAAPGTVGVGGLPVTAGPRAQLLSDARAAAPSSAPAAVKGIIAAGNEIVGKPYLYGGGHGLPLDQVAPAYDCSSSVEHLLYGGRLLPVSYDAASGQLESFGLPGPGRWVTIYASADHVFMYVAGLRWDTHNAAGPQDGSAGIGWHPLVRSSARVRRPPPGGSVIARRLALATVVLTLGGCSPLAAGSGPPRRPQASDLARAQRTHEYPAPPQHQTALGGSTQDPAVAVEAFATAYINWTASTVSGRMGALAALSVGQARSAMALAAAQTAQDYELRRGGIANSGTVEAVALLRGHADEYAVITRELTTASNTTAYQGLRPAWHLALATVTRVSGGGWALSSWQPEN